MEEKAVRTWIPGAQAELAARLLLERVGPVETEVTLLTAPQTTVAVAVVREAIREQAEQALQTTQRHPAGMVPVAQLVEQVETQAVAVSEYMGREQVAQVVRLEMVAVEVLLQLSPVAAV